MAEERFTLLLTIKRVFLIFSAPTSGEITVNFKHAGFEKESNRIRLAVGPNDVGKRLAVET